MATMRDIKRRKESIQSTQQITKAMKLVSTVKLQRAKGKAESAKPYFEKMMQTVHSILSTSADCDHPALVSNGSPKKAVIVITGNRGLAGGYNNNVVKMIIDQGWNKEDVLIYGVGKKGIEVLSRRGYKIELDESDMINEPLFSDAAAMGKMVLDAYSAGEVGEIWLAYTRFKNTVVHVPELIRLLPVELEPYGQMEDIPDGVSGQTGGSQGPDSPEGNRKEAPMNYEPEAEEALSMIIPKYINSTIFGAFIEAVASENGARMQAMDSATSNAEDMIASLSLAYNRARQGAITQELTEIISGAEALN